MKIFVTLVSGTVRPRTLKFGTHVHSMLTICTQTGTCDTRSGDLVFFSAAFDEFSVFTKI